MFPPRTLTLRLLVLPVCQALLLPSLLPPPFPIKVELLDKSGERKTIHTELAPHFSSSRVLHVRFEVSTLAHGAASCVHVLRPACARTLSSRPVRSCRCPCTWSLTRA